MLKVCHFTSVHNRYDPRILLKECVSIANSGFDTTLIVANGIKNEIYKKVKIIDVGKPSSRIHRLFVTTFKIYKILKRVAPDIYHFHDPELIILGIFLRLIGKKVVYDIHEDYYTAIKQRNYLGYFSIILAKFMALLEKISTNFFHLIIAEKYYVERFPDSLEILNYPIIDRNENIDISLSTNNFNFLYTGNITEDRGALKHSALLDHNSSLKVFLIGKCSFELANRLKSSISNTENLIFEGIDNYVPFEKIKSYYKKHNWLAALAIFPKTEHYYQKELTKLFEYMYFGIPILCSNFPVWERIINEYKVGLTVDPNNENEIASAINWLIEHPQERQEMGRRGHLAALEIYNWETQALKLIQFYNKILS